MTAPTLSTDALHGLPTPEVQRQRVAFARARALRRIAQALFVALFAALALHVAPKAIGEVRLVIDRTEQGAPHDR